jgi:hypothetical protein
MGLEWLRQVRAAPPSTAAKRAWETADFYGLRPRRLHPSAFGPVVEVADGTLLAWETDAERFRLAAADGLPAVAVHTKYLSGHQDSTGRRHPPPVREVCAVFARWGRARGYADPSEAHRDLIWQMEARDVQAAEPLDLPETTGSAVVAAAAAAAVAQIEESAENARVYMPWAAAAHQAGVESRSSRPSGQEGSPSQACPSRGCGLASNCRPSRGFRRLCAKRYWSTSTKRFDCAAQWSHTATSRTSCRFDSQMWTDTG